MKLLILLGAVLCIPVLDYTMERKDIIMGGCSFQGDYRDSNQDQYAIEKMTIDDEELFFTLIADGHAGDGIATFIQRKFLDYVKQELVQKKTVKEALETACGLCEQESKILKGDSGSTLLVSCFSKNTGRCDVVWVGDSRGVWKAGDCIFATIDHKLTNPQEIKRITDAGGEIKNGRLVVGGGVSYEVSRSIGDCLAKKFPHKKVPLIADPEYCCFGLSDGFKCYIGGCDGFWNVIAQNEAFVLFNAAITMVRKDFYIKYAQDYYKKKRGNGWQQVDKNTDDNLNKVAKMLSDVAFYRTKKECDNITVVLMLCGALDKDITSSSESESENDSTESSDNDEIGNDSGELGDDSGEGDGEASSESETQIYYKSLAASLGAWKHETEKTKSSSRSDDNGEGGGEASSESETDIYYKSIEAHALEHEAEKITQNCDSKRVLPEEHPTSKRDKELSYVIKIIKSSDATPKERAAAHGQIKYLKDERNTSEATQEDEQSGDGTGVLPHEYSLSVRPDASSGSAVNAALIPLSVRPDASSGSAVNAALIPLSVRPELVEGYEQKKQSDKTFDMVRQAHHERREEQPEQEEQKEKPLQETQQVSNLKTTTSNEKENTEAVKIDIDTQEVTGVGVVDSSTQISKANGFKDTGWQKYGNYALVVGGGLGLLAIIYALLHSNYNPLNFVLG